MRGNLKRADSWVGATLGAALVAASLAALAPTEGRRERDRCVAGTGRSDSMVASACIERLRTWIISEPYDAGALEALGDAALRSGDQQLARSIARQRVGLDGGSLQSLAWLLQDDLARGDYRGAVAWLNRLLRKEPALSSRAAVVLASMLDRPALRRELLLVLTADPPWARSFVSALASSARANDLAALLGDLAGETRLARSPVATPIVDRMLRLQRFDLLKSFLASRALATGGAPAVVQDSGLMLEPGSVALTWSASRQPGSDWRHTEEDRGRRGVVALQSDLYSSSGPLLSQTLFADPGPIVLETTVFQTEGSDPSAFEIVLRCKGGQIVGRSPISTSSGEWLVGSHRFSVPNECPSQTLSVQARSRDTRGTGEILIDAIAAPPQSQVTGR